MAFNLPPELLTSPDVQQILEGLDGLLKGTKLFVIDSIPQGEECMRHIFRVVDAKEQTDVQS